MKELLVDRSSSTVGSAPAAKVNAFGMNGCTPLHMAAAPLKDDVAAIQIIDLLVDVGNADLNIK
ncbi:MAG: hypothetical protein LBT67_00160 [Holosporaceae bacterium]|nr:hypothetical protein [Holosporaceae bacterium]